MYCPTCGAENPEGSKVCEKCGANLTEGIENIGNSQLSDEVEVEYAGLFRRVIAYIIDLIVLGIINYVIGSIVGYHATSAALDRLQGKSVPAGPFTLATILGVLIAVVYFVIMESSKTQGSLGKMALGIKITDENGNRISISNALLRYVFFDVFAIVGSIITIIQGPNVTSGLTSPANVINFIALIYDIILLITILSSEANQGLHDRIAKTYVVMK